MSVQDDRREEEQIELFDLKRPTGRSRDGTDAELDIDGHHIEFELKSTTKGSVTTVRDFGMNHINKWADKHWIFGFYTKSGKALMYTRYASPKMMSAWINEKRDYISLDYALADIASKMVDIDDLKRLCGDKSVYSIEDAKKVHKKQFSQAQYKEFHDSEKGYSPGRMLEILQLRCKYVIERGSTLNNPHIPKQVLETFPKITADHPAELRKLIRQSLKT
ncbi:hypothetical protein [Antarctobacter sp.]|uniref:hypothetical protein n=1 Tax=Antarctobacter sp. TaxID=1872577 RepID=UPI002B2790EC|nr:hypothetical protein [Antarctobacter sp.]